MNGSFQTLNVQNINCGNKLQVSELDIIGLAGVTATRLDVSQGINQLGLSHLAALDVTTSISSSLAGLRAYIDQRFSTLIGAAPNTLDQLVELAVALNNDPNAFSTLSNMIGTKLGLTSSNQTISGSSLSFTGEGLRFSTRPTFENSLNTSDIWLQSGSTFTSLLSSLSSLSTNKADTSFVVSSLTPYYNKTTTDSLLSAKTDKSYVDNGLMGYYSKVDSDGRFISNSLSSVQTIQYLNSPRLISSDTEGVGFIKNFNSNGYYKVLSFSSNGSIEGHKISIEVLTSWGFSLTNSTHIDTLKIDAMICNNDSTARANINSSHYFMGQTNIDCVEDILWAQNDSSIRTSYTLYIKFGVYCHSQVFCKHSTGSTVTIINSQSFPEDLTILGRLTTLSFRSINKYSVRSPAEFVSAVSMPHKDNVVRYSGQVGAWLLNGGSNVYSQQPICWSQQQFFGFNTHDGIVINPGYGVMLFENTQYSTASFNSNNFAGTEPIFLSFESNKANSANTYDGIKLFFRSFTTEITLGTLSV